jgi:RHS repeat-associated protein
LPGLGIDEFLTRTDVAAGTTSHFLNDALGSAVALTDPSGAVQTEYTYEPFGKTTVSGTANTNSIQYAARENDATGLYHYRTRYFQPFLQRFVSEDSLFQVLDGQPHVLRAFLFNPLTLQLYAYVINNPLRFTDPLGLQPYGGQYPNSPIPWNMPYGPTVRDAYGDAVGAWPFDNFRLDDTSKSFGNGIMSNCIRGCLLSLWDKCQKQYKPDFYSAHAFCFGICLASVTEAF